MTSIITSIYNPRSFIYSSNSETLILQSATPETRLSFINASHSTGDFRYLLSASTEVLSVSSYSNTIPTNIQTFSTVNSIPYVETFGSIVASNIRFSPSAPNNGKLVLFRDDNPTSGTQFTGIGISTSTNAIEYRAPGSPYNITSHIFYSGTSPTSSLPLVTMQPNNISGIPQVGIGIVPNSISPTTSLALANDLQVAGNLILQNTIINPSTLVTLNQDTNRISSNIMPSGVVFTSGTNNQIDQSLLPVNYSGSFFKTFKNFGIGTRSPVQRLHVQGNTYITDRLGIGIANPTNRLHVVEYSASIPTAALYNTSGGDVLQTFISSNTINGPVILPVLNVVGTHAGVGIGTSSVSLNNALQVRGNTDTTSLSVENINISNTINANISSMKIMTPSTNVMNYTNSANTLNIGVSTNFSSNCIISGNLSVFGTTTVANFVNTQSDARLKYNIVPLTNNLINLQSIKGYKYSLLNEQYTPYHNNVYVGVIAQEIQKILPEAVHQLPNGILSVKYDSLIPVLIEAIKELTARVHLLESKSDVSHMEL